MSEPDLEEPQAPRRVVGLRYRPEEGLPRVVLKGTGLLADELLARRGLRGPPVVHNEALAASLFRLPVDASIGPELFQVVAAILAHVLAAEFRWREEHHE